MNREFNKGILIGVLSFTLGAAAVLYAHDTRAAAACVPAPENGFCKGAPATPPPTAPPTQAPGPSPTATPPAGSLPTAGPCLPIDGIFLPPPLDSTPGGTPTPGASPPPAPSPGATPGPGGKTKGAE